ncbi:MAG TPA: prepilin peptidase [Candidatus Saccharimonadales bacterium]|nr:prepilin peptidase [Candidatus Saccharimonadales bacterium]
MDSIFIYVILAVLGLAMGSFAGATVWRLRARQLEEDRKAGEKIDKKEYEKLSPLTNATSLDDRSRCLHCGHTLAWYDLLPLVSWVSTGGKCRYCHAPIGKLEPLMELGMATFFVVSFAFWPVPLTEAFEVVRFILWLIAGVLLVILFVYDSKWYLLPNRVVFPLIGVGVVYATLSLMSMHDVASALLSLCIGIAILSGLYFVLWILSKGAWIGFGDVKLGLALALFLGEWPLAFLALFGANLIGCLLVAAGMVTGKISRGTRIPFGPLLIVGAFIAMLWGGAIMQWYFMTFA